MVGKERHGLPLTDPRDQYTVKEFHLFSLSSLEGVANSRINVVFGIFPGESRLEIREISKVNHRRTKQIFMMTVRHSECRDEFFLGECICFG